MPIILPEEIIAELERQSQGISFDRLIEWTEPEAEKSSRQKYRITRRGDAFLKLLGRK
jgi:hypothetical protein